MEKKLPISKRKSDQDTVDIDFEFSEDDAIENIENEDETHVVESSFSASVNSSSMNSESIEENKVIVPVKKKRKRSRKKKLESSEIEKVLNLTKEQQKLRSALKAIFEQEARVWVREIIPTLSNSQLERLLEGTAQLVEKKPLQAQITTIVRGLYCAWRERLLKFSLKLLAKHDFVVEFIREVIIRGHWRSAIKDELQKAKAHSITYDIIAKYRKEFPAGAFESHKSTPVEEGLISNASAPSKVNIPIVDAETDTEIEVSLGKETTNNIEAPSSIEVEDYLDPFGLNSTSNVAPITLLSSITNSRRRSKEELIEELTSQNWNSYFRPVPKESDALFRQEMGTRVYHFLDYKEFLLPSGGLKGWFYACDHCPPPGFQEMLSNAQEYREHLWPQKSIWPEKKHHLTGDVALLLVGPHFSGKSTVVRNIVRTIKLFPPFHKVYNSELYTVNVPVFEKFEKVADYLQPEVLKVNTSLRERGFTENPFELIERNLTNLGKVTILRSQTMWYVVFGHYEHQAVDVKTFEKEGVDSYLYSANQVRMRVALQMLAIQKERDYKSPQARIFFIMEGNRVQSVDFLLEWQANYTIEPVIMNLASSSNAIGLRRRAMFNSPTMAFVSSAHDCEVEENIKELKKWCNMCNLDFLNQHSEYMEDLRQVCQGVMRFILENDDLFEQYKNWVQPVIR